MDKQKQARMAFLQRVIEVSNDDKLPQVSLFVGAVEGVRARMATGAVFDWPHTPDHAREVADTALDGLLNRLGLTTHYREELRELILFAHISNAVTNETNWQFFKPLWEEWEEKRKNGDADAKLSFSADLPLPHAGETKKAYQHRVSKLADAYFDSVPTELRPETFDSRTWDFMIDRLSGLKTDDIAEKYDVSVDTVRKDMREGHTITGTRRPTGRPKKG